MNSLEEFIRKNENEDPSKLLLSGSIKWPELPDSFSGRDYSSKDILVNTISGRKKIRTKLPSWYAIPSIVYPTRLSVEQCSSETTAAIKKDLCKKVLSLSGKEEGGLIADLTSGLGVDVWAFSTIADKVLYNDMDKSLVLAARNNFDLLGRGNVRFCNKMIDRSTIDEVLSGEFSYPDIIFLDPARRSETGKKVFLLEDCSPDVLGIMDKLLLHSKQVVLKLSPMADITMVCDRLEKVKAPVREVHVVSCDGECKELLIWIDSSWNEPYNLLIHEDGGGFLEVDCGAESTSSASFIGSIEYLDSFKYMFEPGKSLTKAGLFNYISSKFSLIKAGRSTHIYFADEDAIDSGIAKLGKVFQIMEYAPLSGKSVKEIGKRYPKSEVTAKNIPMTSDELRKKLGVKSGDDGHIFGLRVDLPNGKNQNVLIIAKRLSSC
ncbi:MAG: class I SAM-dependent methyltransferase [Bacteroidales bacterium]|nr:class I SAM-dependent methyltransferase [Bacteroidales bacterium]